MNGKANNVIRIPTSLDGKFFKYWFLFLRPFHNLTDREMDVVACLLKHRYELSKVITDANILDKVLMGEDTRKKIREECKITLSYFQVIMAKLKKNKIIVDNRINPRFIPNLEQDGDSFKLLLLFELKDEVH